jgi:indole-3-glycerol phosphate synthase
MILDEILLNKKKEVEFLKKAPNSLKDKLKKEGLTLIAEIKKASPSKGLISDNFQPELQLKKYLKAQADAISILTDQKFFQGSIDILRKLRKMTDLPILRKEFIIDSLQIYESFFLGADIILLIAAILNQEKLDYFLKLTHELGLEAIVEVHNHMDLEKAISSKTEIIGINNRNLHDFSVDLGTTEALINKLIQAKTRDRYYIISESGINNKSDIDYLSRLGVDGVLIGETLMRAEDPVIKVKELGIK